MFSRISRGELMFGVWEAIYLLSVFINTFYNEIYVICLQDRARFKVDTERER